MIDKLERICTVSQGTPFFVIKSLDEYIFSNIGMGLSCEQAPKFPSGCHEISRAYYFFVEFVQV